jgi:hypothetical protein
LTPPASGGNYTITATGIAASAESLAVDRIFEQTKKGAADLTDKMLKDSAKNQFRQMVGAISARHDRASFCSIAISSHNRRTRQSSYTVDLLGGSKILNINTV